MSKRKTLYLAWVFLLLGGIILMSTYFALIDMDIKYAKSGCKVYLDQATYMEDYYNVQGGFTEMPEDVAKKYAELKQSHTICYNESFRVPYAVLTFRFTIGCVFLFVWVGLLFYADA